MFGRPTAGLELLAPGAFDGLFVSLSERPSAPPAAANKELILTGSCSEMSLIMIPISDENLPANVFFSWIFVGT